MYDYDYYGSSVTSTDVAGLTAITAFLTAYMWIIAATIIVLLAMIL